jgi:hypothetical protein
MFVVEDQEHPQMMEIHPELQRLSWLMYDYMLCIKFVLHDVEVEEKYFICITIVRNWLLHLGSSTQLLVLLSK